MGNEHSSIAARVNDRMASRNVQPQSSRLSLGTGATQHCNNDEQTAAISKRQVSSAQSTPKLDRVHQNGCSDTSWQAFRGGPPARVVSQIQYEDLHYTSSPSAKLQHRQHHQPQSQTQQLQAKQRQLLQDRQLKLSSDSLLQPNSSGSQIPAVPEGRQRSHSTYDTTDDRSLEQSLLDQLRISPRMDAHGKRVSQAAAQFASTGDFGLTLTEHLKLTSYQVQLLTQTWAKLNVGQITFQEVFRSLCKSSSGARELFQKMSILDGFSAPGQKCCDVKEHSRLLVELIDHCVRNTSEPMKAVADRCQEIGANHLSLNGRGMRASWFDELGDNLAEMVTRNEAVRAKREAGKAWIGLLSFVMDQMKSGYQAEVKRKNTLPSAPSPSRNSIVQETATSHSSAQRLW